MKVFYGRYDRPMVTSLLISVNFLSQAFSARSLVMEKRTITSNCQSSPRSPSASFPLASTGIGSIGI